MVEAPGGKPGIMAQFVPRESQPTARSLQRLLRVRQSTTPNARCALRTAWQAAGRRLARARVPEMGPWPAGGMPGPKGRGSATPDWPQRVRKLCFEKVLS